MAERHVPKDPDQAEYEHLGEQFNLEDILEMPDPEPLVITPDGKVLLEIGTAVMLVGDTGTNKTFMGLGLLCSISTGVNWLGHKVKIKPGPVLLVVGEGSFGIKKRVKAWIKKNGVEPQELYMLRKPSYINNQDFWDEVTEFARKHETRAVFFDTLSSLAPGIDEVKEAASVVRWMSDLAVAVNGTVIMAHHTPLSNSTRSRGGTQFEDNADAVITLQRFDSGIPTEAEVGNNVPVHIVCKKVKEGPDGYNFWVRRELVDGSDSCVLELCQPGAQPGRPADRIWKYRAQIDDRLRDQPYELTESELGDKVEGTKADIRKLIKERIAAGEIPTERVKVTRSNGTPYSKTVLGPTVNGVVNLAAEIRKRGGHSADIDE